MKEPSKTYEIEDGDLLFVVDMQRDFIDGVLGSKEAKAIVPNVKALVDRFVMKKREIVLTQDTHAIYNKSFVEGRRIPGHCIVRSSGWGIDDTLVASLLNYEAKVVNKNSFMVKDPQALNGNQIKGDIQRIFICGLCTDICVVSNALALRSIFDDREVICVEDCCAGTSKAAHEAALTVMRSCLIDITKLEDVKCIIKGKVLK